MIAQSEIPQKAEEVLSKVRHFLQKDGGDVEFVRFDSDSGYLYIRFLGNCFSCPLNIMTLQAGLMPLIQRECEPWVKRVEMLTT